MIILDPSLLFDAGTERECYYHPDNKNLCIKVRFRFRRKHDESEREYEYFQKYIKIDNLPLSYPRGWIDTNLGRGMLYDLVRNYDGTLSRTLYDLKISKNKCITDLPNHKQALDNFIKPLADNAISVRDMVYTNIAIQYTSPDNVKFILIDGLGLGGFLSYFSKSYIRNNTIKLFKHMLKRDLNYDY